MEEQPLYKVSFGGDTTEDYHVSISTRIYRDDTAKHVLHLNTISTIEAVLIDRHFRRLKQEHGLTTVDFMTGGGKGMSFFLQYTNEATASAALYSFSDYYQQIFNSEYEEDYFDGRIYPLSDDGQL